MEGVNNGYRISQDAKFEGEDWWTWWIWIEGSSEDLDQIEYVTYTLHPTFPKPVRKVNDRSSKFILKTEGWGIFTIYAKLTLKNKKEISLEHELSLRYPDGTQNVE